MRKGIKKFLTVATAAVMAAGVFSLASCRPSFETPTGIPEGDVVSNGGFAVQKGDYVYFINGVESYTSDNTYGTPVRGSLMRVKAADVAEGKNTAEKVIPSLMVGGDYVAGIYIYGERVYYTSPNTVKDASGEVQNGFLNFMSAKLDGTDIREHYRVSGNTTVYRVVELEGTVYFVYLSGSDIYSFNTATNTRTLLVSGAQSNTLGGAQTQPEWIYYTMNVVDKADSDGDIPYSYQQIYRVRADWTETSAPGAYDANAPYHYEFDMDYVNEHLDGEVPYYNLGEIVLDGIGTGTPKTENFNHSDGTPATPYGYTYSLRSSTGEGIYFTRAEVANSGSATSYLYYLSEATVEGEGYDSVTGNASLDFVSTETTKASANALYYIEEGTHHYIYADDSSVYNVDIALEGGRPVATETEIAHGLSSPTLRFLGAGGDYKYVYYTCTSGGGVSVNRAVYNGSPENYEDLPFGTTDNTPYKAVKILDVQHNSAWYPVEILGNVLYYADASTAAAGSAYNYIATVSLDNGSGGIMNNAELAKFNEKYDALMDADDGYFAKLNDNDNAKLSSALKYYFYTGERTAFDENIKFAVETGKKSETYLYSEKEQQAFGDFVEGKGDAEEFVDENGKSYRTLSYFVTPIGEMAEADKEARATYWTNNLEHFTAPEAVEEGLPAWAWALIGVAIGVVVLGGAAVAVVLVLRAKKKKGDHPDRELLHVDTADDRNVDVYAEGGQSAEEAPAEEAPAEEAPVEEAPAEGSETSEPSEAPADDGSNGAE